MKKMISLFLAILMIICMFFSTSFTTNAAKSDTIKTAVISEGYSYIVLSDGTAEITAYVGSETSLFIPDILDGYSVTSIGEYAFAFCEKLTSINIPDSVTNIGNYAFCGCYNLTSITIPDNVTRIGDYTFAFCENLTSINLSDSIASIGNTAFGGCYNLASITIPDSVTSIDDFAFHSCEKFTSIIIPSNVTYIGESVFSYCLNLTDIIVDNNNGCYSSLDGVLFNKEQTTLIYYPIGKTAITYSIPNSVTCINDYAFEGLEETLTSITIPSSVTHIGKMAFFDYSTLTNISVDDNNSCYSSLDGVLFNKEQTLLVYYPIGKTATTYIIPKTVTSIEAHTFYCCYNLASITIPVSVTNIGELSFAGCDNLETVYYMGSESQRENIKMGSENRELSSATWYYNVCYNTQAHSYSNECDPSCAICGYVREPLHSFQWITDKKESCEKTGLKHEECTLCGHKQNENTVIEAIGKHSYGNTSDTLCNICGNIRPVFFITFDLNGGTGTLNQLQKFDEEVLVLPKNAPNRNGYRFAGWSTTKNGKPEYASGDNYCANESVTLYAQWNLLCTPCSGSGITSTTRCTDCSGNGKIKITCNPCSGNGKKYTHAPVNCYTCGGDGRVQKTATKPCSSCNGKGRYSYCGICGKSLIFGSCTSCFSQVTRYEYCSSCNGKGSIPSGTYTDTCNTCSGTGSKSEYVESICISCNGSGWDTENCEHCNNGLIGITCTACKGTGIYNRVYAPAPNAPVLVSKTSTSIIIESIENGEYSIDGINWQTLPKFKNLDPNKTYAVYQRHAKTDTTLQSEPSPALQVTTDAPGAEGIKGDTDGNGKINIKDATLIQKAVASMVTLDEKAADCADATGDGKVNIKDATAIQKFIAGIIDSF